MALQLDFFMTKEETEMAQIRRLLLKDMATNESSRKSLHAKNGKLTGMVIDLEARVKIMERGLCKK